LYKKIVFSHSILYNMLSIQQIKEIKQLHLKKNRVEKGCFIAETPKVVEVLLKSNLIFLQLLATDEWFAKNKLPLSPQIEVSKITETELGRISGLKTPHQVLAILKCPLLSPEASSLFNGISLVLDDIRDPGNLGTIIRIADWYGIDRIICSLNSADAWQNKCVQASMGSIANTEIVYMDLDRLMALKPAHFPVYGMFLEGENIYSTQFAKEAMIVIGNEAHGISASLALKIDKKILIPQFSKDPIRKAESLNASIATAVVCSELRRSC
ncbi:MAG: RNA methyltransferase, partial [Bacteroidales bacterium]